MREFGRCESVEKSAEKLEKEDLERKQEAKEREDTYERQYRKPFDSLLEAVRKYEPVDEGERKAIERMFKFDRKDVGKREWEFMRDWTLERGIKV